MRWVFAVARPNLRLPWRPHIDPQIADSVDNRHGTWLDHGGGVDLLYDGGALDAVLRSQPVAKVDPGGIPAAVSIKVTHADQGRPLAGARQRRQIEAVAPADHGRDQVDKNGTDLGQAHMKAGEVGR